MPVSEEVMELVRILDEEGFGALAGELLTEVNLGREGEEYEGDQAEPEALDMFEAEDEIPDGRPPGAAKPAAKPDWVVLDNEVKVQRRYADLDGGRGRSAHLAGQIAADSGRADRGRPATSVKEGVAAEADPVRIVFVDTTDADAPMTREEPGRTAEIDKLDDVLARLRQTAASS